MRVFHAATSHAPALSMVGDFERCQQLAVPAPLVLLVPQLVVLLVSLCYFAIVCVLCMAACTGSGVLASRVITSILVQVLVATTATAAAGVAGAAGAAAGRGGGC